MGRRPPLTARQSAEYLLACRPYSVQGLRKKLAEKEFDETDIEAAIMALLGYGYLNDDEYARRLAESLRQRSYGPQRILQELRRKGVEAETAQEVLAEQDEEVEPEEAEEQLDALLRKLNKGRPMDMKEKNRLAGALARRGFAGEAAWSALRRLAASAEADEDVCGTPDEYMEEY